MYIYLYTYTVYMYIPLYIHYIHAHTIPHTILHWTVHKLCILCFDSYTILAGSLYNNLIICLTIIYLDAPNVLVPVSPSPTLTVNVTDTFTINCTVFGIPLPNITWTTSAFNQDMDPLDSTNEGITIVQSDDGNIRTSLLTFSNVSKMAEGEYVCSGQNFIENVLNTPLNGSLRLIIQGIQFEHHELFYINCLHPSLST